MHVSAGISRLAQNIHARELCELASVSWEPHPSFSELSELSLPRSLNLTPCFLLVSPIPHSQALMYGCILVMMK